MVRRGLEYGGVCVVGRSLFLAELFWAIQHHVGEMVLLTGSQSIGIRNTVLTLTLQ